jgi:GNAT superfamily N-acetyltransferase
VPEVRPFIRSDRDGLASLANRHIAAVLPGGAVPIASLLSQLERDAHEPIVDPWVVERHTVVAVDRDRLVAAAYLKRYGTEARVSESCKNLGEIDWLIFDPREHDAGRAVIDAATAHLASWGVREWGVGNLPCLGVYGIPDAWPHVQQLVREAGFDDEGGQVEVVFAGDLARIDPPGSKPDERLAVRRVVGPLGTSFEAVLEGTVVGVFEVEDVYGATNRSLTRWADVGNHRVHPDHRGRGIGSWLFRHGCEWLRLGGKDRLLAYATERWGRGAIPTEGTADEWTRYFRRFGLQPTTRTRRGWHRAPAATLITPGRDA